MPKTTPRQALTACADHVREVYGRDAADLIAIWRDSQFPESERSYHRWARVSRREGGVWIDRRCVRCGVVDQFGSLDGREVAHYVLPDGSRVRKKAAPTPPCEPLGALSADALSNERAA